MYPKIEVHFRKGGEKIMTLAVTASGNFDNKKSPSGLRKHMEHDNKLNHTNQYLNTETSKELRKFNRHKILIDYQKFTEKTFAEFVKQHDENTLDKRKKFGSVKRFLQVDNQGKQRKNSPAQMYVEKLADEKTYWTFEKELEQKVKKAKFVNGPNKGKNPNNKQAQGIALTVIANGLQKYADDFNKRNSNIKMFEYWVHMDEKGAAHLHAVTMPVSQPKGKTKTGKVKKPSWSLNRALGEQYGNFGKNKENLKKFRKQEDQALIDCMNKVLEKQLGLKNSFKLIRKTEKDQSLEVGQDHEVYKAKMAKIAELDKKIAAKQAEKVSLEKQNNLAKKEKETAEKARDQALKDQAQAEETKRKAQEEIEKANQRLKKREEEVKRKEKNFDTREKDYNAKIIADKKKIDSQTDKIADLENGIVARQDLSDSLDDDIAEKTDLINKLDEESQNLQDSVAVSTSLSSDAEKKRLKKQKELADLQKKIKEQKEKSKNFEKQISFAKKLKSVWVASATVFFEECDDKSIDAYKPKDLGGVWYSKQLPKYKNSDLKVSQLKALGKYQDPFEDTIDGKPKSSLQNIVDTAKKALKKPHVFINAVKKALKKAADLLEDNTLKKDVEKFDSLDVNPAKANLDIMKYNQKQNEERRQREDGALKLKPTTTRPSFTIGDRTKNPQKENNHEQNFDF